MLLDISIVNLWNDLGFSSIEILPLTPLSIFTLILILLLLVASGYMSSSEVAFFSLSPQDIHEIRKENEARDPNLLKLLSNSERLLATILIGNNIVNIAIVVISNYFVGQVFKFNNEILSFTLQTIVLTFLLLLFGEIIPKVYAQSHTLSFCRFSSVILFPIYNILKPFSTLLVKTTMGLNKISKKQSNISVDDLSMAVELTIDKTTEQSKMIGEIIKFYNKIASDIMVSRVDMTSIDYNSNFDEVLPFIIESGYSRIPVYESTQDNIKGILYIKDCIPFANEKADFDWQKLIRPAYFVPENKKIDDLLEEFRFQKIHISIVVDEYGGTSGLITLEDILEEIVGEITDEYDEDELPYTKLNDGSLLFEAKTPINDFCRLLNIDPQLFEDISQEVDTLSGIYLEIKKEIPLLNGFVSYKDFRFEVTKLDKFRILQMKVSLPKNLETK